MKLTTRDLVTLTVFGTLWGAVEISLGALLHGLKVPLSGPLLAAMGLSIAIAGRLFVPRRGSTLYIGLVATILKLFSLGSVVVGPMIGIMAEALVAEVVLSVLGRPSRPSFVLAGALGVLWTLVQPFVTGLLLFGRELADIWSGILEQGSQLLTLDTSAVLAIVLALVALYLVIGGLAGWLAWDAGRLLQSRLRGPSGLAPEGQ